jgi:hypothetical protein
MKKVIQLLVLSLKTQLEIIRRWNYYCKKVGGRYLIVSPKKAELNLFWEEREKAIAHTEEVTGTSGWFIPSSGLLMNEGIKCKKLMVS